MSFNRANMAPPSGGTRWRVPSAAPPLKFSERKNSPNAPHSWEKNVLAQLEKEGFPQVKEIRGKGLLIGIELQGSARPYCERLAEMGVLCKETHDNVIRIAPPLNIPESELSSGVQKIVEALRQGH